MKPRLSRSLRRILAGVVVSCLWAQTGNVSAAVADEIDMIPCIASSGIAWRSQMERELRVIRDRTVVMNGGIPCCVPGDKAAPIPHPHCDLWANAERDYQNQFGQDGLPGYKFDGLGGTFGIGGRIGERWFLGGAVTGMSGRVSSKYYQNNASGDLDAYYASIFTRFDHGCWSHTLIGTFGWADVDFKRRGNLVDQPFETHGDPDGWGLGVMYEVARSFRLNSSYLGSAWWQPVFNVSYIHSRIDSYTETNRVDPLHVDRQDYDNVTFGIGARMQAVIGSSFLNQDSQFNLRVLGKFVTGPRRGKVEVGDVGVDDRVALQTSRGSAAGVEVGGGVSIPLGEHGGSIFAECTAEFADNYRSVNGVLGYRLAF